MRALWITVPLGICLAAGGLFFYVSASQPPRQDTGIDFNQDPKHPITDQMVAETAKQTRKVAPKFDEKDALGELKKIGGPTGKPQFVLFILDGCPCSVDAQPLFNRLYKHFDKQIDFIGVTNGDLKMARDWKVRYSVPFSIVPDASKKVIRAYEAKHSVYSALIDKDGKITKMWPGYSYDIMLEMNKVMAAELGTKEKPFDPTYAPKKKSTGCAF